MKCLALSLIVASALPATAQDLSSQYNAAELLFGYPVLGDVSSELKPIDTMIGTLEGNWVPLSLMVHGGMQGTFAEATANFCAKVPSRLVRDSPHGFSMIRTWHSKDGVSSDQRTQFQFLGGTSFAVFADEIGKMKLLGIDPTDATAPNVPYILGNLGGILHILHPSNDILIFVGHSGPVQIWGRCP